ncbi:MAG TPA: LysR family transcriptional regulator [Gammaproteobacteria bacterium]
MNSLDWNDIRFFLAAAHSGSLAAASRQLGSHQPTVGRHIDTLEKRLGVRLFQRHAQGLTLTEEGQRILQAAEAMGDAAAMLHRIGTLEATELRGSVRIAAPSGLAVHLIAPHLPRFCERYPALDVTLQPSASSADLTHGEADVAIRLYRPDAEELVVRHVGAMGFGLYGSSAYLQQRGVPQQRSDMARHYFIAYGEQLRHLEENRWLETLAGDARFVVRSDDTHTRLAAAAAGVGLAVLPHILAQRFSQLQRVIEDAEVPSKPIWLVVHRDLRHLARVRAVLDWLMELFSESGLTALGTVD